MAIGIGIGIPNILTAAGPSLGTTIATTHYNRVIADGGVVPAGISGLASILNSVISAYSITGSSDFNTKVPVFLDPHYTGYKLGAGSGTTLGQAARTVYAINSSADVTQATAVSQPLLLAYSGTNYWWNGGVNANYCSTPNAAANQITGDIDIIAYIGNYANNGASLYVIASKGDTSSYVFDIGSSNFLELYTGGSSYSTGVSIGATYTGWVRCTRVASSGLLKFYTSTNSQTTNPQSVTWTQSGSNISTTAGNLGSNTNPLAIGGHTAAGLYTMNGKIYRATISNSIGGTPVVDFNPASYSASTSQTAWTSSTGETWTINKDSATSGFAGQLVDRTLLKFGGDAQLKELGPNINIQVNQPDTVYSAFAFDGGFVNYEGIYDSNTMITRQVLDNAAFSGNLEIFAGGTIIKTGLNQTSIKLATSLFNGVSSSLQVNNGTATTGNAGTQKMDGLRIGHLSNISTGYFLKGLITTILVSSANDGTTTRTSLYNIIRSMNNNAF